MRYYVRIPVAVCSEEEPDTFASMRFAVDADGPQEAADWLQRRLSEALKDVPRFSPLADPLPPEVYHNLFGADAVKERMTLDDARRLIARQCEHPGCIDLCEPTYVFCKPHRLSHCGETDEEKLETARKHGWREGMGEAAKICRERFSAAALTIDDGVRFHAAGACADSIRKKLIEEG